LGTTYEIKFTTKSELPELGQLKITFATGYNVTNSSATVSSSNLVASSGQTIGYSLDTSTRTFTITNLAKVTAGSEVSITFYRIDNPDIVLPADFTIITANSSGQKID
jgi:hypothetical protein